MSLSFAYQFPDVVSLKDLVFLLLINRPSAVHHTLHTRAHIRSSASFSQDLHRFFGLSLLLLVLTYPVFDVFYMSEVTCLRVGMEATRGLHILPEQTTPGE